MSRWRTSALLTGAIGLILTACLLPGCALEPILIGQWYAIETPAAGGCPPLVWRFVVDAHRSIAGSLSLRDQQRIAALSGGLGPDDSFQITAAGVAGNHAAKVTGRFTSQISTIFIQGDAAGDHCDGQTFNLRLGDYFMAQGGGGGGGGN
jgi:hypothetical protein